MNTEPFRIGTLATRSGRSIHTIRWYESQGLIPGVERDAGGRRVYVEQPLRLVPADRVDAAAAAGGERSDAKRFGVHACH